MAASSLNDQPNGALRQEQILQECAAWVTQHLPPGLPPSARRAAVQNMRAGLEASFWRSLILRIQNAELTEKDLEELRFRLFRGACCEAAKRVEMMERGEEMERWRYVPRYENGASYYLENLGYCFNTTYDYRKLWFEFQLQLERTALPDNWVREQAMQYEAYLNRLFQAPHWRWDGRTNSFVEISDSKWVDGHGVVQPNPDSVRGTTERYSR